MFKNLSDRLSQTLDRIRGQGRLSEENIKETLREIRMALLEADVFVDKLDDAMNHYEVRSEYAHQLGQALANAKDQNVFRSLVAGSLASHLIDTSGDNDGTQLTNAAH